MTPKPSPETVDQPTQRDFDKLHDMLEELTHLCAMGIMSSSSYLTAHTAINDELIAWNMRRALPSPPTRAE